MGPLQECANSSIKGSWSCLARIVKTALHSRAIYFNSTNRRSQIKTVSRTKQSVWIRIISDDVTMQQFLKFKSFLIYIHRSQCIKRKYKYKYIKKTKKHTWKDYGAIFSLASSHIVSPEDFRRMPSQNAPLVDLRCSQRLHLQTRSPLLLCNCNNKT